MMQKERYRRILHYMPFVSSRFDCPCDADGDDSVGADDDKNDDGRRTAGEGKGYRRICLGDFRCCCNGRGRRRLKCLAVSSDSGQVKLPMNSTFLIKYDDVLRGVEARVPASKVAFQVWGFRV